jgi:tripartite ATP-independent transporter DctM subunit
MNTTIGVGGIIVLFLLLLARLPVALALVAVSFFGVYLMVGLEPAVGIMASAPYDFAASWTMSAIPMFLLMGFVSYHTGITGGLFHAARAVFARVPGGLAISSVFACSGFATVCGSSIACAAAMGRIAIPEMVKAGYNPNFAAGSVAAGGTIGALIPPSIIMIIYGVLAETSVTKVFLGGIFAGLMTAVAYSAVIFATAKLRPDLVPNRRESERFPVGEALRAVWPVLLLIVILFGGLFSGFFTATEAGAMGGAGAILVAALSGRLSWTALRASILETMSTTASLFIISVGAAMFTRFLGLSGAGNLITALFSGWDLSQLGLLLIIIAVYLVLGMFMEPFGAMMITLPIFLPILDANQINLIWFGVLLTKLLEVGMITPPFGMNVFVIKDVASRYVTLSGVFKGVVTFLIADAVVVALLLAWPAAVMWLPNTLN